MKKVIVTGGAGFIGSHLIDKLLSLDNYQVTCIDNFDLFYDTEIKKRNISGHINNENYKLIEADICDFEFLMNQLHEDYDVIIHLAAKAGVRPSLEKPIEYQRVNVIGTQSMLEIARLKRIKNFVFASSSSVYGINKGFPWSEEIKELMPISPYASSKISGEWLGKCYSEIYDVKFTALRFFTVFGPRQRPDLAINKFVSLIEKSAPITVFGDGTTMRDYTYISDIVQGILAAAEYGGKKFEIFNIGNSYPIKLNKMIQTIEFVLNIKAKINYIDQQTGDVPATLADISKANKILKYQPATTFLEGITKFIEWKKDQE